MSDNICTCEKCSGYRVTDPLTGLLTQGRVVGKKEMLAHRRLEGIKQHLNDATGNDVSDASSPSQLRPRPPALSNPSDIQQGLEPGLFQRLLSYHGLNCSQRSQLARPFMTPSMTYIQNFPADERLTIPYQLEDWSLNLLPTCFQDGIRQKAWHYPQTHP